MARVYVTDREPDPQMIMALADKDARIQELKAALRKAQGAIALCFSEGGRITAGDATTWWAEMIEAQRGIATALRKATS